MLQCFRYSNVSSIWYSDPHCISFVTGIQEPALQRATGQAFRTGEGCARQKLRKRTSVNGGTAKQTGENALSGILIFINAPKCSFNDSTLSLSPIIEMLHHVNKKALF